MCIQRHKQQCLYLYLYKTGKKLIFSPILEQINKWWHVHTKGDNTSLKRNKLCEIILINITNNILRVKKPDQKNIFIYKVQKKKKAIHGDRNEECYCLWKDVRVVIEKEPTGKFVGCRHYSISLFGYWFHKCIYFVIIHQIIHVFFDLFLYLHLASIKIYLK